MQRVDYDEVRACLSTAGAGTDAAEAHGTLCGLLCMATDDLPDGWLRNTFADAGSDPEELDESEQRVLAALYDETAAVLSGMEFEIRLLLPDDATPLTQRADALGRWCQGFLYGLAARGLKHFDRLPSDMREILEDLSQIALAEFADGEGEEEGEHAYANLVEFVRVGVQLIYDELNPPAVQRPAVPGLVH